MYRGAGYKDAYYLNQMFEMHLVSCAAWHKRHQNDD